MSGVALAEVLVDRLIKDIQARATDRQDLIILVDWMHGDGFSTGQIADAVRKPWHYEDELAQAKAELTGRA